MFMMVVGLALRFCVLVLYRFALDCVLLICGLGYVVFCEVWLVELVGIVGRSLVLFFLVYL